MRGLAEGSAQSGGKSNAELPADRVSPNKTQAAHASAGHNKTPISR